MSWKTRKHGFKVHNFIRKYKEQTKINQNFKMEIKHLKLAIEMLEDVKQEGNIVANTREVIKEMYDREHRKNNLVIFRIQIMNSDETK